MLYRVFLVGSCTVLLGTEIQSGGMSSWVEAESAEVSPIGTTEVVSDAAASGGYARRLFSSGSGITVEVQGDVAEMAFSRRSGAQTVVCEAVTKGWQKELELATSVTYNRVAVSVPPGETVFRITVVGVPVDFYLDYIEFCEGIPCGGCLASFTNYVSPPMDDGWLSPPIPPPPGGSGDPTTHVAPLLPSSGPQPPAGSAPSQGWFVGSVQTSPASAAPSTKDVQVNPPQYQAGSLFAFSQLSILKGDGECERATCDAECLEVFGCFAEIEGNLTLQGLPSMAAQFATIRDSLGAINKRIGDPSFYVLAFADMECGQHGPPQTAEVSFDYVQRGTFSTSVKNVSLVKETLERCQACGSIASEY